MELTYSNQLSGFDPEKRYRNPEHFDKPEAGVTSVLVIGHWPSVVDAYESAGIDVSVKEAKQVQLVGAANQVEPEKSSQLCVLSMDRSRSLLTGWKLAKSIVQSRASWRCVCMKYWAPFIPQLVN